MTHANAMAAALDQVETAVGGLESVIATIRGTDKAGTPRGEDWSSAMKNRARKQIDRIRKSADTAARLIDLHLA